MKYSTELKHVKVGMQSCIGVGWHYRPIITEDGNNRGFEPHFVSPPYDHANYFSDTDGYHYLNIWAENLQHLETIGIPQPYEVALFSDGEHQWAVVTDERIPKEYLNNKLCFTGYYQPPREIVVEIEKLLGSEVTPLLELYDDPRRYYARRGQQRLQGGVLRLDQEIGNLLKAAAEIEETNEREAELDRIYRMYK